MPHLANQGAPGAGEMSEQQLAEKIKKYENFLTINQRTPLVRASIKDQLKQMDSFKQDEARDLEKLNMALKYSIFLNNMKRKELDQLDTSIKQRADEKNIGVADNIKAHNAKI